MAITVPVYVRRFLVISTVCSAIVWAGASTLMLWKYLDPPEHVVWHDMSRNLLINFSEHAIRLRFIRDYDIWQPVKNQKWAVVEYVDTFGLTLNSAEPLVSSTQRWGIFQVFVPYWLLTTATAFLPFVWMIRVASREQKKREAALAASARATSGNQPSSSPETLS